MTHCPCKRAKSLMQYLKSYTFNYLKSCILDGHMPVITIAERVQAICGAV